MYQDSLVVRTKLAPPRLHRHTLHRDRLTRRLLEAVDHQLTIVQASTGFGKTTALAGLAGEGHPLVWYQLEAEDADPLVFLLHLIHAFSLNVGGLSETPLATLERWENDRPVSTWPTVVDVLASELDRLVDGPVFLVLDDAHYLNQAPDTLRVVDRFVGRAPTNVHPILSSRYPLQLPGLVNWRVRGQVLEIGQDELAFTPDEVATLYGDRYGLALSDEQAIDLVDRIEGWPIALQLVWQRLQRGKGETVNQALGQLSRSAEDLFAFLTHEVLSQQPDDIQDFLRITAVLRRLTAANCNCLRAASDSEQILRYLVENELFVVALGDGQVRYHRVFRDFLRHRLQPEEATAAHLQAADCYRRLGDQVEALYHLLAAEAYAEAAGVLVHLGRGMVRAGRLDTLSAWIGALPPDVLEDYPALMAYLGDIARLHSRFEEALGWYQQAEGRSRARGELRGAGQALRGQARVYLDTVNPSKAETLLQEALRLSDGQDDRQSRARLLELLAENLINRGRLEEAEAYQVQARELREEAPAEAEISMRLLLRMGRLEQARNLLEERAKAERQEPVLRPRAHRETLLLLSLVHAFQGHQEAAYRRAIEGTERGQALQSHFITAVGYMRQGHAWLLRKDEEGYEQAARCFLEAIALSEQLDVPRIKIEAFWGLCLVHGFQGDLVEGRRVAEQGIELAQSFGDEWVEACIRLAMGAGYTLAGRYADAATWLVLAGNAFRECSDTHGQAVTQLWQCLVWQETADETRLERDLPELLQLVRQHGYDYLFHRKTLQGPPDPRVLVPILLFARGLGPSGAYAGTLLNQLGLGRLAYHPGYQLRVQAFGQFRVWRGHQEISAEEWQRKKTRQIFLLLLTYRERLLDRDQIIDLLWPDLGPEEAQRDFKIAISALYRVLEPARGRHAPSAYILRDGTLYGLRPGSDLWLDAQQFETLIAEGDSLRDERPQRGVERYRQALALYQGEYLREYPYEAWSGEERERLLVLYLSTAERVAQDLSAQGQWEEVIEVCRLILAHDDCWENAYRLTMAAHEQLGNRTLALRTYQRCVERLRSELDVAPSPATGQLYQSILTRERVEAGSQD